MSTEQKSANSDQNALSSGLSNTWTKFKQGELISYPVMALILVVITAIAVTVWIMHEGSDADSARWTDWDGLTSIESLEKFIEENPDSRQARVSKVEVARLRLSEGIEQIRSGDPNRKKAAVDNLEKAREAFISLAEVFKEDKSFYPQCLYGSYKAEAALVGVPKEGQLDQYRGNPDKVIEWAEKLAEAAPDTDWAKDAKKLADVLRNPTLRKEFIDVQSRAYSQPAPVLPDPKTPFPKLDPKQPGTGPQYGPVPSAPGGSLANLGGLTPPFANSHVRRTGRRFCSRTGDPHSERSLPRTSRPRGDGQVGRNAPRSVRVASPRRQFQSVGSSARD
ncbi:MAG: hypothetical protein L0241_28080 [Planctomycetia bacterium]|nr:hypothetical protein [Planctomycetia bacterium]